MNILTEQLMGTWGTDIFDDDEALDIQGQYEDLLGEGISGAEASKQIIHDYEMESTDSSHPDIARRWLILALCQHKFGTLDESTKSRALAFIVAGGDASSWHESDQPKRLAALNAAAQTLRSPQVRKAKPQKPRVYISSWQLGDVFSYRLRSGRFILIHIVGIESGHRVRTVLAEILDWIGTAPPSQVPPRPKRLLPTHCRMIPSNTVSDDAAFIARMMDVLSGKRAPARNVDTHTTGVISLWPENDPSFQAERWTRVGVLQVGTRTDTVGATSYGTWDRFDVGLEYDFGLT